MNTDVILIQPKSGFMDYASKRLPLGILSIGGYLHEHGFSVKIIDQKINPKGWRKELEHHTRNNPLFVGISAITGMQIHHGVKASNIVRNIDKKIPIVWGGIHPSMTPIETVNHPDVDVVVIGEGELASLELANAYKHNKSLDDVTSICYKKDNGGIKVTDVKPPISLDDLPPTPYDLVDFDKYSSIDLYGTYEKSASFESSRGCVWRCGFCYINSFYQNKWRVFSPETVIERLQVLVDKYKVKSIYFTDDEMALDTKRFEKIIDLIIASKMDIRWGTQGIRIDTMDRIMSNHPDLMDKMYKAGNRAIDVGLESGNERILKLIQKDITKQKMLDIIKKLTKFRKGKHITIKYNLMAGFPTETKEEMDNTVKWGESLTADSESFVLFNIFAPFAGTPLYPLSLQYGFKPPTDLEGWADFTFYDWFQNYPSWHTKKSIEYLSGISFAMVFNNKAMATKLTNKYTRLAFQMYSPVARFRLKHKLFKFFFEKKILNLLEISQE